MRAAVIVSALVLVAATAASTLQAAVSTTIRPAPAGTYAFAAAVDTGALKPRELAVAEPRCTQTGAIAFACDVKVDIAATNRAVTGSLVETARGLRGSFAATCDLKGQTRAEVGITGAAVEIKRIDSAFGTQKCTWNAALDNGGRLAGTLAATNVSLAFIGGASPVAELAATLRADVLGGAGPFAALRGAGTFRQTLRFALPTSVLDSAIDRAIANALGALAGGVVAGLPLSFPAGATAPVVGGSVGGSAGGSVVGAGGGRAVAAGSALDVKLAPGKPAVRIVWPPDETLKPADRLRVATAPGASCVADAKQVRGPSPGRSVSMGYASDRLKKGDVEFPEPPARKLGPLTWDLSVACENRIDRFDSRGRLVRSETVKTVAKRTVRVVG